jgi:fatty-acyl-CoA synthase
MFELLSEQADKAPNALAAISVDRRVSYAELYSTSSQLAGRLYGDRIRPGDRVGLLSNNRIEWLEIFFALAALGAVIVPFSTWSTASELEYLINDSGICQLFLVDRFGDQDFAANVSQMMEAGQLPGLERCISISGAVLPGMVDYNALRSNALPLAELPPGERASAADPLIIVYTSGSSSRPKAVPLDHFASIENGFNIGERQGLVPGDRVLVSIPLFWSYGAINALPATLSHGASLVLQSHFEARGALDLIERENCTAIYTLPAITNALTAHADFLPERTSSLRTGVTIGAPQDIVKAATELGAREICNIYGGTENYGNCCVTPSVWSLEKRSAAQGPPLPGVTIRIRDPETGELLGAGNVGEIEVRGYLTRGYDGASAAFNAETFTEDGYFKTGDLGSLDEEGAMHFAGRRSEMIKRSGINVSPAEVEEALQQHDAVGLAGVTGLEDADRGEIIVAFLVPKPGANVDSSALLAHCRERLSRYKVPDRIITVQSLPLTVTGKLMRRELRALATKIASAGEAS